MSNIQRWGEHCDECMEMEAEGEYVKYEDHVADLTASRKAAETVAGELARVEAALAQANADLHAVRMSIEPPYDPEMTLAQHVAEIMDRRDRADAELTQARACLALFVGMRNDETGLYDYTGWDRAFAQGKAILAKGPS